MDFNTLLLRLGIDSTCFENRSSEPIKTENGFIYEVEQRKDIRICPHCGKDDAVINDYDYVEINCSETSHITDTLRIKKVRFKCKNCYTTFTPAINGIERYAKISTQTRKMIVKDFASKLTFSEIAKRYGITTARVLQIFDEEIKFVPRRVMPRVLCIDEIRFNEEYNQKYCCVLYDFEKKEIVDIIKNRQMPYLDEYFSAIPEKERRNVKYFISDMYDAYHTVQRRYFPRALHIVDLFHVITQLTNAVNRIRTITMKRYSEGSIEYNFMKSHWSLFLCRAENIPDKYYTSRKNGRSYHYDELINHCVKTSNDLLEAYTALQDLFHYHQKYTYKKALAFIDYMSNRLISSPNDILISVGKTYHKWHVEIARAFSFTTHDIHYTNAIAESLNNHLKTIIKSAYGYHNFDRFRKRAMLIITYKKI